MSSEWQLQTAKNRLSELVDVAMRRGPQTITRRGKPAAVVVSARDYERIKRGGRRLAEFFSTSPLAGVRLKAERDADFGRDVRL